MKRKKLVVGFFVVSLAVINGVSSTQAPALQNSADVEQTPKSTTSIKSEDSSLSVVPAVSLDQKVKAIPSTPSLQNPSPLPTQEQKKSVVNSVSTVGVPSQSLSADSLPIAQKKESVQQQSEDEMSAEEREENKDVLDTVNTQSTSGNWVFKNYWWKKIQDVYSQIRDAFNTVMTARMKFFEDRNAIDKELDTFYQKIGLEQGQLQDILEYSLQIIEKEKEDQGYLDKKEREFLEKIKEKQRQLEQLREDIKAIEELDQKIDDALEIVLQQVDVCNKYMQTAWDISRDVARELSDKEARKQYYDTKGLLDDVNKVHQYFIGPFSQYFAQMIKSVHDHTRGIALQIETLKNSGLDLKKESRIFQAEDEELERKKVEAQEDRKKELERRKQNKEKNTQENAGMLEDAFTKVKDFFGVAFDKTVAVLTTIKNFFNGIVEKVKGLFFDTQEKVEAVERVVKKETKEIEKDSEEQVYNAEKVIDKTVEDTTGYVKEKLHDGTEYIEKKAHDFKEKLDNTEVEGKEDIQNLLDDL